jgi:cell division protein FtsB
VRDLKSGLEAIEERARYELGMIKEGEVFVQVPQKAPLTLPPARPVPPRRLCHSTRAAGNSLAQASVVSRVLNQPPSQLR